MLKKIISFILLQIPLLLQCAGTDSLDGVDVPRHLQLALSDQAWNYIYSQVKDVTIDNKQAGKCPFCKKDLFSFFYANKLHASNIQKHVNASCQAAKKLTNKRKSETCLQPLAKKQCQPILNGYCPKCAKEE